MTLSDVAIRRPVLTWVMMAACIVFGLLGLTRLGVDQFPAMEFPTAIVGATLPGGTPETLEDEVADPLEEALASLSGLRELRSTSSSGGVDVQLEFDINVNLDVAMQEIREKIGFARSVLPPEVEPPLVARMNATQGGAIMWAPLQTQRSIVESTDLARRVIKPMIESIPGVASASVFGPRERNIRVWLDADRLRARGLAAADVLDAIRREHIEIGAGAIEGSLLRYGVKTQAKFESIQALAGLTLHTVEGAPVRLSDVARVVEGAEDELSRARFLGEPSIGFGIAKQSGANTVSIADQFFSRVDAINARLPPDVRLRGKGEVIDMSVPIREAVDETNFALVLGAVLAVFTVFIFLRRWRPTLIVAAAIPLSLVTTFGVTWMFGFTLNTMTLLAMALAVGVVIDDAIVVLENIERHREAGMESFAAAHRGTREIAFAATAATVAIAVVFLPAVFAGGVVGSFLGEFGLTVASAVLVSLFVALTLTPMLAARIPHAAPREGRGLTHWLEVGFERLESGYRRVLNVALARRGATIALALAAFVISIVLALRIEGEFMPPGDEGIAFSMFKVRSGSTLDGTMAQAAPIETWLLEQPDLNGLFFALGMGANPVNPRPHEGVLVAVLKPAHQRTRSRTDFITALRAQIEAIPGLEAQLMDLNAMMSAGFSADLVGNLPMTDLDDISRTFLDRLEARGGFVDLDRSLELGLPQIQIIPDRDKAAALGIDAATVGEAVRAMIGGVDVGTFQDAGRGYDIRVRLEEKDRLTPGAIGRLPVRSRSGGIVELRNFADIRLEATPSEISRVGRMRSVRVNGNLAPGKAMSEAIAEARAVAEETLPEGMTLLLAGQAAQYEEGTSEFGFALFLAVVVIYLVLAAQFESFLHPFTVMLALPLAMVGALSALAIFDMTFNLFSLIGIIMLFGLATKNSILLVDYANQLREEGMDKLEAMRTAAPVRLRPVLMTAVSMIFGVLPAAIGVGPGATTRQPMAMAVAAGMLSSTILTLIVVPAFYVTLDDANEGMKRRLRRLVRGSEGSP